MSMGRKMVVPKQSILEKYRLAEIDRLFLRIGTGVPVAIVANIMLVVGLSSLGKGLPVISPEEELLEIVVTDLQEIEKVVDATSPPIKSETVPIVTRNDPPKPEPIVPQTAPKLEPIVTRNDPPKPEPIVPQTAPKLESIVTRNDPPKPEPIVPQTAPKLEPIVTRNDPPKPEPIEERDNPQSEVPSAAIPPIQSENKSNFAEESNPLSPTSAPVSANLSKAETHIPEASSTETSANRGTVSSPTPSCDNCQSNDSPDQNVTLLQTKATKLSEPHPENKNNPNKPRFGCLQCDKPSFPPGAKEKGIEGEVKVSIDVDADGTVIRVGVVKSSGHSELDQAAIEQAKRWRFTPSEHGRQEVAARIDFQIEGTKYQKQAQERQRQREIEKQRQAAPQPMPDKPVTLVPPVPTSIEDDSS